jgi:8-oxo-dGTP diphosphatase
MAREYPPYPLTSCHVLVREGNRILLVQRARPPFQGYWSLPGGGLELGETVEQGAIREVREETGLEVELTRFLGFRNAIERDSDERVRWHYTIFYFDGQVVGGSLCPGDDAAGVKWVSLPEVKQHQITDTVEACLQWLGFND